MDKNGRPLEVEDKVNLTLFINAITNELRTRKYVKGYRFLSFARKYKKQILDKGLDALKTAFPKKQPINQLKQQVKQIVKPKREVDENSRNVEEIIIPPEKRKKY